MKAFIKISLLLLSITAFVLTQPPKQGTSSSSSTGTLCDKVSASMQYSISGTNRVIKAMGCPGWDWTKQVTPDQAYTVAEYSNWQVPVTPVISTTKIYVGIYGANNQKNLKPVMGTIGITYNGVGFLGNANLQSEDAYVTEVQTFDNCNGHVNPQLLYHVHSITKDGCGYKNTQGVSHSPVFAIMADGIPIFGPYGDNGVAPTDLDECGGHTDKTHGFYHYHLPKDNASPYSLNCLVGCIFNANGNNQLSSYVTTSSTCTKNATQYDYSGLTALLQDYVTTTGPISTTSVSSTTTSTSSTSSTTGSTTSGQTTSTPKNTSSLTSTIDGSKNTIKASICFIGLLMILLSILY